MIFKNSSKKIFLKQKTILTGFGLLVFFLGMINLPLSHVFAAEYRVPEVYLSFSDALTAIENAVDPEIDNTIVITDNTVVDNTLTWPTTEKRIFIQTETGDAITFRNNASIPDNIKLVIDTPNAVFENGFNVTTGIEIRKDTALTTKVTAGQLEVDQGTLKVSGTQAVLGSSGAISVENNGQLAVTGGANVTAQHLILGDEIGSHGSALVSGENSELTINGTVAATPTLNGTGQLNVTGGGKVNMLNSGSILFNGNALFDQALLTQSTNSLLDVQGGRIDFDHGTIVTSTGTLNAANGVFVNDDSQLNVGGSNGVLNITGGGLFFSNQSTFGVTLDATGSGKINAGNGVALDGNLLVRPEYGYYANPVASTIIESTSGATGQFNQLKLTNDRLGTLVIDPAKSSGNEIGIIFTPSATPYSSFTRTRNETSVGRTFDAIQQMQLANFAPFMQQAWNASDTQLRALYNDLSGEIRAHTMAMPLANPGRMAFERVAWDSATGHVFFGPQYRLAGSGSRRATWLRPYYIGDRVDSDGNAAGYNLDGYGFVGGIDQTLVGGKSAVGLVLGYGRPELESRNNKAELDDFIAGVYFASRLLDSFEVKAWGGYGYQYYDMNRRANVFGTPQAFKSNFKGHTATLSGEIARPIYTYTRLVLKPSVGYEGLFLKQKAGSETGDQLLALDYQNTELERHIGRIGLSGEYGDSARSLYGGAHYKYLLGGDDVYYSQASFAGGGPSFIVEGVNLGKSFISGNIGLQVNLTDDRSRMIFVDYNVDFGDHGSRYQTATFGLQQIF